MKHVKIMSTLALSAFAINTVAPVVFANDATDVPSYISFKESTAPVDPGTPGEPNTPIPGVQAGDLAFLNKPTEFNFGQMEIASSDNGSDTFVQKNYAHTENAKADGDKVLYPQDAKQIISVHDGRTQYNGWTMQVSATAFENAAGETLDGATFAVANAETLNTKGDDLTHESNFTITTDGTASAVIMQPTGLDARGESELKWAVEDLSLHVPVKAIGDYSSTITFTLVGQPDDTQVNP